MWDFPLAISLARSYPVIGFDIDANRVGELEACEDRTREVEFDRLRESTLTYSADPASITGADIYIVTVPTPVTANNQPDLGARARQQDGRRGHVKGCGRCL